MTPANPVSVTGGEGTGATFNLIFSTTAGTSTFDVTSGHTLTYGGILANNGAGTGTEVSDTINDAETVATTATGTGTWAGVTATITDPSNVATYTTLAGGGIRELQASIALGAIEGDHDRFPARTIRAVHRPLAVPAASLS